MFTVEINKETKEVLVPDDCDTNNQEQAQLPRQMQ